MEIDYSYIGQLQSAGKRAVVCTIVSTVGNTPRHGGSKMVVFEDGTTVGTVGGGSIELEAVEVARGVLARGKSHLQPFHLRDDVGMICGGEVTIFFEPLLEKPMVYIFGGGHVGQAIVKLGVDLGFEPVVVDGRDEVVRFFEGSGVQVWQMDYKEAIEKIKYDDNSYFIITTPRHEYDETILAYIAKKPHRYVGMMASPEKVRLVREKFLREGVLTKEVLDRIDMPIGVPIKCETPADIAVSVLARLVDVRNGGEVKRGVGGEPGLL